MMNAPAETSSDRRIGAKAEEDGGVSSRDHGGNWALKEVRTRRGKGRLVF